MRARYLDVRRATVAAAVVDGKGRRLIARGILRPDTRVGHGFVYHVQALGDCHKETRQRSYIKARVEPTFNLCPTQRAINRRFLMAEPFRDLTRNFVSAGWTLQRGIRVETPPRKPRAARSPDNRVKHALDRAARIRI